MSGTIIKSARNTPNAPQDLGPYTQSVAFSHYNNIAAQLPVDPKTGALVAGDIQAQARQCLTNIQAIVQSVGHGMEDMVKVTLFLADIADLDAVNAVYREFFPHSLPTRTVLAVASLPLGARVQMDALLSNGKAPSPGSLPAAQDLPQQRPRPAGSALQPERRLLPLQQYRCPAAPQPRIRRSG